MIAVDWGTSSFRAYRLGAEGRILDQRSAARGILTVEVGGFANVLAEQIGAWLDEEPGSVFMSGMIGSRQGWKEVPYLACPVDLEAIARACGRVDWGRGRQAYIVPGVSCRDPHGVPDVMRGEETQILGAFDEDTREVDRRRVAVLPGTHSKWALAGDSRIETFATFLTGELYAVLREHSILGRLAVPGDDVAALERGVRRSLDAGAGLSHDLFSARTLALTGDLAPDAVGDYLSGLLLGAELAAGRRWLERQRALGERVHLIGDAALCERYRRAFGLAGLEATIGPADAAARGLWRIARRANLVKT
jgi:2-dehydro-3-deoxygalactonokinase